jgi:hypothetical protein
LARFDGLDGAVPPLEKDARVIGSAVGADRAIHQGQAIALDAETGKSLDKVVFTETKMPGDRGGLVGVDFDEAGPSAAMGAALAMVMNFLRRGHATR